MFVSRAYAASAATATLHGLCRRRGSRADEVWILAAEPRPVGASARLALHEPDSKLAEVDEVRLDSMTQTAGLGCRKVRPLPASHTVRRGRIQICRKDSLLNRATARRSKILPESRSTCSKTQKCFYSTWLPERRADPQLIDHLRGRRAIHARGHDAGADDGLTKIDASKSGLIFIEVTLFVACTLPLVRSVFTERKARMTPSTGR
jgi:hypothetical protein